MHSTLQRQINRTIVTTEGLPQKVLDLINLVSETYTNFDRDRALTERSLEISSRELGEKNKQLNEELLKLKTSGIKISELEQARATLDAKASELEKINQIMIDREDRMIDLKNTVEVLNKQIETLKASQTEAKAGPT